jgi:hypothetical protein
VDALGAEYARSPLPPALRQQQPYLAGPIQGLSDSGRRPPVDRPALRGTQSSSGEAGSMDGELAMVLGESILAAWWFIE